VQWEGGEGLTRDFSTSGVYFETDQPFLPGHPIDFALILEHADPEAPVRVQCRGEVVRVEASGQGMGVAVAIRSYRFDQLWDLEQMQIAGNEGR
jgi:hypothetical protein